MPSIRSLMIFTNKVRKIRIIRYEILHTLYIQKVENLFCFLLTTTFCVIVNVLFFLHAEEKKMKKINVEIEIIDCFTLSEMEKLTKEATL